MKKSFFYFILGLLIVSTIAFVKIDNTTSANSDFADSFSKILLHAKEYTLEVAEAMPEDGYTFRPTDSVRSFGEQMAHIGMSSKFILNTFIKDEKTDFDPAASEKLEKELGMSKTEVVKLLNEAFDNVIEMLKSMDNESLDSTFVLFLDPSNPEFTKKQAFLFIRDHVTHHRGQAIVSLRMKGEKAPSYRAF
ncbi:MAG: DinB family protein [Bacteroidetes bacterium]|nr:DinB family protein [Bacteroidota bacterium]